MGFTHRFDTHEQVTRPVPSKPGEIGSLMVNRFGSLAKEDLDIPSLRKMVITHGREGAKSEGMTIVLYIGMSNSNKPKSVSSEGI